MTRIIENRIGSPKKEPPEIRIHSTEVKSTIANFRTTMGVI